jgi:hypothetical protein
VLLSEHRADAGPAMGERHGQAVERADRVPHRSSRAADVGGRDLVDDIDDIEKARKTVSTRIHRAIRTLHRFHPALADHLQSTVDTGSTCTHRPTEPTHGQL